jgi:putative sigma-54 modulation protein
MNLIVKGKNIDVTDALKDYVEKRVGKLEKYFEGIEDVTATLIVENNTHRIEVQMPLAGVIIRGEESTSDMYTSIDLVVDKLEKQIAKYKTRLSKHLHKTFRLEEVPTGEPECEKKIVRSKRFAFKPMPAEEAVLQMNLIGHNFFVFMNAETEEVNVVYMRKDGNYGLIEPKF